MTPLEALLDDGSRLLIELQEQLEQARRRGDGTAIVELASIAQRATDPLRATAATQLAAAALVDMDAASQAIELLLGALERDPLEPVLLEQLGVALLALQEHDAARRIFAALQELLPEQTGHRVRLDACRMPGADGPTPLAAPRDELDLARVRERVRDVAASAVLREDRSITLCMIVKDEEAMLPECLRLAAPYVDELVIVDTGSTDRTIEIAESFDARVIERAWDGSFAAARNAALDAATSDWVLWLDADEHMVEGDGRLLREHARRTWVEGCQILMTHHSGTDHHTVNSVLRLIRNRKQYRWSGVVHEQILHTLPTWLPGRIEQIPVRVNHYGYQPAVVLERDKRRRNLELLHVQLAHERSPFTCFNVGTEHAAMGEFRAALDWFEEALELARRHDDWQQQGFAALLVQRTIAARRAVGELHGAVELATRALAWWPEYTDLRYERAAAYAQLEAWSDAARDARRAIELGDAPSRFVAITGKGSFQARILLAAVLRRTGELEQARDQLEQALEQQQHSCCGAGELVEVLLELGLQPQAAAAHVDELLGERGHDAALNLVMGSVFHDRGMHEVAAARYVRVLDVQPQHVWALTALAQLELDEGSLQAAWETGTAVDPMDPNAAIAARSAMLAAAALGDPALVTEPARRIADSELLSVSERGIYAAWALTIAGPKDGVHAFVPQDELAVETLFANLEALAKLEATEAFEQLHELVDRVVPDERARRLRLADLYVRLRFADMAAEELLTVAQEHGVDAGILTSLGKVATIKQLWDDAELFLTEALALDPASEDARRLLTMLQARPTA